MTSAEAEQADLRERLSLSCLKRFGPRLASDPARSFRGFRVRLTLSRIVAVIAEAVTGPTPGMVINRLAVSSALTDAAISVSIAPIASSSASI